jgi:hypothetical protein
MGMKRFLGGLAIFALLLCLGGLSFVMGSDWGEGAAVATAVYGVLITIFLALQVYAFVMSQVHYSEDVENAKFELLEREGIALSPEEAEEA